MCLRRIKYLINSGSERTRNVKKNVLFSFCLKPISVLISLIIVPLTIDFVSPKLYGLWLTLSSIIVWFSHFDFGFANGFRNRFAEARAMNDIYLARTYLSTTYAVLGAIFFCVCLLLICVNSYINWGLVLNIDAQYNNEIREAFYYLTCFFCLNFVLGTLNMFLSACQMPSLSALISTVGQVFSLFAIFVLSKSIEGSLKILAFCLSGLPCFVTLLASFIIYVLKPFNQYKPSIRFVDIKKTMEIMTLGAKFFIVTISTMVIYQFMNLIITRELGAEAVTQYNLAYKYLNIAYLIVNIITYPIWSAFTDAYTRHDNTWMVKVLKKMDLLMILCFFFIALLVIFSHIFYDIWIGDKVRIPFYVTFSTALYVYSMSCGLIYMMMINGIGKIRLQLIVYVLMAIFAFPVLSYSCKHWGIVGILSFPTMTYLLQAALMRLQLRKLITNKAYGIWNK